MRKLSNYKANVYDNRYNLRGHRGKYSYAGVAAALPERSTSESVEKRGLLFCIDISSTVHGKHNEYIRRDLHTILGVLLRQILFSPC